MVTQKINNKLKYTYKETALKDLLAKGVYIENKNSDKEVVLSYGDGIQAVVELGLIVLVNGVYDDKFNEVVAPVYADGYHFDVMSENKIDFGKNEITVKYLKTTVGRILFNDVVTNANFF